jgi:hypothetical protein
MRCRLRPKHRKKKAAFWQEIVGELPAYLHLLENEFEIPVEWRSSRFGVKEFQNPQLLEYLDELSPATILLELIDQLQPWGVSNCEWQGTSTELRQLLIENERTRREAQRLLDWNNACGQYLGELAKTKKHRSGTLAQRIEGIRSSINPKFLATCPQVRHAS